MTSITIQITQADIDTGDIGMAAICPIALAIERALPGLDPCVSLQNLVVDGPRGFVVLHLPQAAQQLQENLQAGNPVAPFQFQLDLPFSVK